MACVGVVGELRVGVASGAMATEEVRTVAKAGDNGRGVVLNILLKKYKTRVKHYSFFFCLLDQWL